jgi:hypothetical protein
MKRILQHYGGAVKEKLTGMGKGRPVLALFREEE